MFFFRVNLEAMCHNIRNANFMLNTEATATFMFYMNRLLAMSFDGH
jgi:hypothetical protein